MREQHTCHHTAQHWRVWVFQQRFYGCGAFLMPFRERFANSERAFSCRYNLDILFSKEWSKFANEHREWICRMLEMIIIWFPAKKTSIFLLQEEIC